MKAYQCHKRVKAAQINDCHPQADGSYKLGLDTGEEVLQESPRYRPVIGDYLVEYEDGYRSVSPRKAFEDGYSPIDAIPKTGVSFGNAIVALKSGARVARAGWNGKGMWLGYIGTYDVSHSLFTNEGDRGTLLPWIGMHTADNGFVPWLASQTDMLAMDWQIVEEAA